MLLGLTHGPTVSSLHRRLAHGPFPSAASYERRCCLYGSPGLASYCILSVLRKPRTSREPPQIEHLCQFDVIAAFASCERPRRTLPYPLPPRASFASRSFTYICKSAHSTASRGPHHPVPHEIVAPPRGRTLADASGADCPLYNSFNAPDTVNGPPPPPVRPAASTPRSRPNALHTSLPAVAGLIKD